MDTASIEAYAAENYQQYCILSQDKNRLDEAAKFKAKFSMNVHEFEKEYPDDYAVFKSGRFTSNYQQMIDDYDKTNEKFPVPRKTYMNTLNNICTVTAKTAFGYHKYCFQEYFPDDDSSTIEELFDLTSMKTIGEALFN